MRALRRLIARLAPRLAIFVRTLASALLIASAAAAPVALGATQPPPAPGGSQDPPKIKMTLHATPRTIALGRRSCVRFLARAEGHNVREADLTFAGRSRVTNSGGRAVVCVSPHHPGKLVASASKPSVTTARVAITVRR
jgi:hypothetical protein